MEQHIVQLYFDKYCLLINFYSLLMQDYKRDAFREAYLKCSNAIQNMEKELRTACHASDAKVDNVLKVPMCSQNSLFMIVRWL